MIDIILPAASTNGTTFLSRNSCRRTGRLRSRDSRRELYLRAQIAEDADSDDRGEGDGDTSGSAKRLHTGTGGKLFPQDSLAIGHVRGRSTSGQGNFPYLLHVLLRSVNERCWRICNSNTRSLIHFNFNLVRKSLIQNLARFFKEASPENRPNIIS